MKRLGTARPAGSRGVRGFLRSRRGTSGAWGDAGTIYYWVEEHRARAGDFSNTWLILQCG